MTSTAEWLESIGLGEYAQRFAENAIDFSILRDLTDQDLKELGVLLGHRRKMLRSIAGLGEASNVLAGSATEPKAESRDEAERRHLTVVFCDLVGSAVAGGGVVSSRYWCSHRTLSGHDCLIHGRWCARVFRLSGRARG